MKNTVALQPEFYLLGSLDVNSFLDNQPSFGYHADNEPHVVLLNSAQTLLFI